MLVFVGIKMLMADLYPIPIAVSLAVVAALIGGSIMLSLGSPRPNAEGRRPLKPMATVRDTEDAVGAHPVAERKKGAPGE